MFSKPVEQIALLGISRKVADHFALGMCNFSKCVRMSLIAYLADGAVLNVLGYTTRTLLYVIRQNLRKIARS